MLCRLFMTTWQSSVTEKLVVDLLRMGRTPGNYKRAIRPRGAIEMTILHRKLLYNGPSDTGK
jgi:hypothetical protein